MPHYSARYDTREALMEALVELMALEVPAEGFAPVLSPIGPVDLDLLADGMNQVGLNLNRPIPA